MGCASKQPLSERLEGLRQRDAYQTAASSLCCGCLQSEQKIDYAKWRAYNEQVVAIKAL